MPNTYFTNFSDFLTMGQHGFYVWASWGVVLLFLSTFILYSRQQRKDTVHYIKVKHAQIKHRKSQSVKSNKTAYEQHKT